jgi:predicted PilT family ATPase
MKIEILVPDTSVVIEGLASAKIESGDFEVGTVLVHEAILAELEHQANSNKEIGFVGLEELKKIRKLAEQLGFKLEFGGKRPGEYEIMHAKEGEIDNLIRQLALETGGILYTADKVLSEVALTRGIQVIFAEIEAKLKKLAIEKFFDSSTMSVHIKEKVKVAAKKGKPGNWTFETVTNKPLDRKEVKEMAIELVEEAGRREDGFIEIDRPGSTIVQIADYRTVIARPPFSDGWEITVVRPVARLKFHDYKLTDKLKKRISEQAEGLLIAGAPGMGKCLPSDEIVYTKDMKTCTAEQLFNSTNSVIYSVNELGEFTEDRVLSKHKREETVIHEIITRTNKEIKVTPEHPLLVFEADKVCWKPAAEIKNGERIATLKKIMTNEDDSLNLLKYYNPETTLCFVFNVDKTVPIYFRFIRTPRKILELIYLNQNCNVKEACRYCSRSPEVVRNHIKKLEKDGFVHKKNERYYLAKENYNIKDYGLLLLKDILELGIDKDRIEKIAVFNDNTFQLTLISLPKKITPSLCRFLAYIYSEGGGDKLSFTNTDQRLVKDFKECAKQTFGITEWKQYGITSHTDWQASIRPLLDCFGYPIKKRKKSRIMKLPDFLMRCSLSNLKNFLEVYFDCDGGVDRRSRALEYYTSSSSAARQLSLLLMRFGIYSSLHKKFRKGAYRYTIRIFDLGSIKQFAEHICSPESKKYYEVLFCKEKKYSQTLCYDLRPLISKFYGETRLKKSLSIEKCTCLLEKLYKVYHDFSSRNENLLILLKEYIDTIDYTKGVFDENKKKLNYSLLRKSHIDHNCTGHWQKGRKIKICTLNKVAKVLGCGVCVSPQAIAALIKKAIGEQNLSICEVAREMSLKAGTLQFRLINGWNTNINEIKTTYAVLYNTFIEKKKGMEYSIKLLEILFGKDLIFDKVVQNRAIRGNFDVYDFETANHNFICGKLPLIVHNSTFAQALAEHFASQNKIVKTVEAPRDLHLPDEITQYAISHGTSQEIHDILLLSRPDYTIFDEMRNTEDFRLFADLRLAGVGMLGVVHGTAPIDAIQRFIGRIELGVIPQVIDTVVFIKNGQVHKVFDLKMEVKVPNGMTESDLARPVVTVRDFETGKLEFEIYSYGEETVVVPVVDVGRDPAVKLIEKGIEQEFQKYADIAKVHMLSRERARVQVPERFIAKIIGKKGQRIESIEKKLGIKIDIEQLADQKKTVDYEYALTDKNIKFLVKKHAKKELNVYVNDEYLMTVKVGNDSVVRVRLDNQLGTGLLKALKKGDKVELAE